MDKDLTRGLLLCDEEVIIGPRKWAALWIHRCMIDCSACPVTVATVGVHWCGHRTAIGHTVMGNTFSNHVHPF